MEWRVLADWIESPQYSLWSQVVVIENLAQALTEKSTVKSRAKHIDAGWLSCRSRLGDWFVL